MNGLCNSTDKLNSCISASSKSSARAKGNEPLRGRLSVRLRRSIRCGPRVPGARQQEAVSCRALSDQYCSSILSLYRIDACASQVRAVDPLEITNACIQ